MIVTVWKVLTNNIITNERSKYWTNVSKCQFCELNENVFHRYFECHKTYDIWKFYFDLFNINYNLDWKERLVLPSPMDPYGNIKSIGSIAVIWTIHKKFYDQVINNSIENKKSYINMYKNNLSDIINSFIILKIIYLDI